MLLRSEDTAFHELKRQRGESFQTWLFSYEYNTSKVSGGWVVARGNSIMPRPARTNVGTQPVTSVLEITKQKDKKFNIQLTWSINKINP